MIDQQSWPADPGPRCLCGHPEHAARCPCGCRTYIAAGSHPDQSYGGHAAVLAVLVAFAVLIVGAVTLVVLTAAW
jgi:hypothetical protein